MVLRYAPEAVHLSVKNAPPLSPPAASTRGSGCGLAGLNERALALGGTFHAGAESEGGFGVEMTLPS